MSIPESFEVFMEELTRGDAKSDLFDAGFTEDELSRLNFERGRVDELIAQEYLNGPLETVPFPEGWPVFVPLPTIQKLPMGIYEYHHPVRHTYFGLRYGQGWPWI